MASPEYRPKLLVPSSPDRSPVFDISHHPAIPEVLAAASGVENVIVSDGDETLWNTVEKHHSRLARILSHTNMQLSAEQLASLPTLEALLESGGDMDTLYSQFPLYAELHERMMAHPGFNRRIPLIHPDHPRLFQEVADAGFKPVLLLTTRPAHLEQLTRNELARDNFPNMPVIARPDSVDRAHTAIWKLSVLWYVVDHIDGTVFMIDDNRRLAEAIHSLNHPRLKSVLYPGPITRNTDGLPSADWHGMLSHLQSRTQGR